MKNKFKARLEEFFTTYPTEQACILTGDGAIFLTKHKMYAQRHADDVSEQIEEVSRADVFPTPVNQESTDAPVVKTQEELEAMTKAEIVAYAATLGLTLDPKLTKAELIAAVLELAPQEEEDYQPTNND